MLWNECHEGPYIILVGIKNMMSASQKRKSTNLEGLDVLFTEVMPPSSKKAKVDVESPVKTARGRRVAAKPATPKTAAVKATRGRKAVRLEEAASPGQLVYISSPFKRASPFTRSLIG